MSVQFAAVTVPGKKPQEFTDEDRARQDWRHTPGARLVMVVDDPSDEEIEAWARELHLHPLAVEDAQHGHQRSKMERYEDTLFMVLHSVCYDEGHEQMRFGEIHVFLGQDYVLVLAQESQDGPRAKHWVQRAFRRSVLDPSDPQTFLYYLMDGVVDEYEPVLAEMDEDLDEIEEQLFTGESTSQRIYELFNEVVKFQRVTRPMAYMVELLMKGGQKYGVTEELHQHYRDVRDHVMRAVEHLDSLRSALQNALTIESTLVGERQNEAQKKMSAWAGILIVPTIIAGIYGMNFERMPELGWAMGYPFALGLMFTICLILWLVFKKKNWL